MVYGWDFSTSYIPSRPEWSGTPECRWPGQLGEGRLQPASKEEKTLQQKDSIIIIVQR